MTKKICAFIEIAWLQPEHLSKVLLLTFPVASPPFPVLTGFFVQTGGHCGSRGHRGTVVIGAEASPVRTAAPSAPTGV